MRTNLDIPASFAASAAATLASPQAVSAAAPAPNWPMQEIAEYDPSSSDCAGGLSGKPAFTHRAWLDHDSSGYRAAPERLVAVVGQPDASSALQQAEPTNPLAPKTTIGLAIAVAMAERPGSQADELSAHELRADEKWAFVRRSARLLSQEWGPARLAVDSGDLEAQRMGLLAEGQAFFNLSLDAKVGALLSSLLVVQSEKGHSAEVARRVAEAADNDEDARVDQWVSFLSALARARATGRPLRDAFHAQEAVSSLVSRVQMLTCQGGKGGGQRENDTSLEPLEAPFVSEKLHWWASSPSDGAERPSEDFKLRKDPGQALDASFAALQSRPGSSIAGQSSQSPFPPSSSSGRDRAFQPGRAFSHSRGANAVGEKSSSVFSDAQKKKPPLGRTGKTAPERRSSQPSGAATKTIDLSQSVSAAKRVRTVFCSSPFPFFVCFALLCLWRKA